MDLCKTHRRGYTRTGTKMSKGECLNEIYNFSSNIEMKNIDLVKKICKLSGHDLNVEFVKDRPGHDHRYSVSSEKYLLRESFPQLILIKN